MSKNEMVTFRLKPGIGKIARRNSKNKRITYIPGGNYRATKEEFTNLNHSNRFMLVVVADNVNTVNTSETETEETETEETETETETEE